MGMLKVGLVSTSQLSFAGDKKLVFNKTSQGVQKLAGEWGFELFVYPEDVITAEDAYEAVKVLEDQKVDFVLLQCTSFSAGFLAPIFARTKNARLGLWAIPETLEGAVQFNSFCSINMYSGIIGHYLKDYKVPIKWFFGDVEDDLFKKRLAITIRVLKAIKKMTQSKVALVGGIAPGFDDLYDDERKLIRLFDGIRINRLHEYSELRDLAIKFSETEVAKRMNKIAGEAKGIHVKAKARLEVNARFSLAYEKFIDEYKYDGVAISCWPKFQEDFQYSVCSVVAELNDNGTVAACEGDLTSAISMLLLQYIAEDNTMLMDLSAFDTADDTVLMWHCGPASKRYCRDSGYSLGLNYSGAAHEEDSKEIDGIGVTRDMIFDPEKITIARLTGESDKMFLAEGEFISNFKKSIHGSRGWVGNLKLNRRSISALDFVNTILVQRFQHHFPIVAGDYSKEVMEAMAWLNLKQVKAVPYEDYMQNPLE